MKAVTARLSVPRRLRSVTTPPWVRREATLPPSVPPPVGAIDAVGGGNAAAVAAMFAASVTARTVGNAALRKYMEGLLEKDHELGIAAIHGARRGGLRVNASTYDAYLDLLLRSRQIRTALDVYAAMRTEHLRPTTHGYTNLMKLCVECRSASAAIALLEDMRKSGRRPNVETLEVAMNATALESPVSWQRGIALFEEARRVNGSVHGVVTASTYCALMRVYAAMTPMDWRVVYNCYYDLRSQKPDLNITWEAYEIVATAMKQGHAGYWRRITTYADAWVQCTGLYTPEYWLGAFIFVIVMIIVKTLLWAILIAALKLVWAEPDSESVAIGL